MKWSALALCVGLTPPAALAAQADSTVRFYTALGTMDVHLLPGTAPRTVTNFLSYMNRGAYNGSVIHRSVPGFIFQGGGYKYVNGQFFAIPADSTIANEFHASASNVRGTLAMALGNGVNTATSEWFFNESDANAASLDLQQFTVFGRVTDAASLQTMDALAAVPVPTTTFAAPFNELPLRNYVPANGVTAANLVIVDSIAFASGVSGPDYSITANPSTVTITRGSSGSSVLTVQPENGYAGTVTFGCGTLPASASCTFSPTSLTFASDSGAEHTTLTVSTTATSSSAPIGGTSQRLPPQTALWASVLALLAILFSARNGARPRMRLAGMVVCAAALTALAACGSDSLSGPTTHETPVGTYSVPITITDGSVSHPLNLSIVVQ